MNEKNSTNKIIALMRIANKKFINLNKGSKILLKIGAIVFFAFLLVALALSVLSMTGMIRFDGQAQLVQWIVIYSFRFWVMMIFGSLIMDILMKR
jgi:hypothetical protein